MPPTLTCKRCGHEWYQRQAEKPGTCPKCKSALWQKAPKKKG